MIIKKYSMNLCDKILNLRKQIITTPIYTTKCHKMKNKTIGPIAKVTNNFLIKLIKLSKIT